MLTKFLHRDVVKTTGSKLALFKVRIQTRQFIDVIHALLSSSPMPHGWKPAHECMFVTIPACVIEHAYPAEAARFADFSMEVIKLKILGWLDCTLTEPFVHTGRDCHHLMQVQRPMTGWKCMRSCMLGAQTLAQGQCKSHHQL